MSLFRILFSSIFAVTGVALLSKASLAVFGTTDKMSEGWLALCILLSLTCGAIAAFNAVHSTEKVSSK